MRQVHIWLCHSCCCCCRWLGCCCRASRRKGTASGRKVSIGLGRGKPAAGDTGCSSYRCSSRTQECGQGVCVSRVSVSRVCATNPGQVSAVAAGSPPPLEGCCSGWMNSLCIHTRYKLFFEPLNRQAFWAPPAVVVPAPAPAQQSIIQNHCTLQPIPSTNLEHCFPTMSC